MASLLTVSKAKESLPGRYIITLKGEVSLADHVSSTNTKIASTPSNITHEYNLINAYAGEFSDDDLNDLRAHPEITSIEEDGTVQTCSPTDPVQINCLTQTDAPWGLGRITSKAKLTGKDDELKYTYKYESSAGKGADVYVIDTGIYTQHPAFGGRARWGKTFGGYADKDGHGHGTHCAGTAVSGPYGVAKAANVIAVKVLSDQGSGRLSDVISGMLWVAEQALNSGRPSVASMSLGGGASDALDKAVKALYDCGVTVVVAAGNSNDDASHYSPARAEQAITVGASNIGDARTYFSNYGPPVDIFAAGLNVISTWNDGKTNMISGTSMATPHVAGFAAYLLGIDVTLTPAQIAKMIDTKSLKKALSDVPANTANKLLHNQL
jgi:cerevisin